MAEAVADVVDSHRGLSKDGELGEEGGGCGGDKLALAVEGGGDSGSADLGEEGESGGGGDGQGAMLGC